MNDYDDICQRLDEIAEELAERAISELGAAVRRGEQQRPKAERTITQARRAIDKAVHLLRAADGAGGDRSDDVD